jgi:RecA/RadA recombinase
MADDIDDSDSGSTWGESCRPVAVSEGGRIVTFSQDMDALFQSGGPSPAPAGIPVGQVTEICGAAGTGKTTLALQLALDVQMPPTFGGAGGGALYVDTEGGFFPERLNELAIALSAHVTRKAARLTEGGDELVANVAPATLMRNVRVYRATTIEALAAAIEAIPRLIAAEASAREKRSGVGVGDNVPAAALTLLPVRLVVIDSVALHLRHVLAPMDAGARVRATATLGAALHSLAMTAGVAVVVINHVTTKISSGGGSSSSGGGSMAGLSLSAATATLGQTDARALSLDGASSDVTRLVPALGDVWAHVPAARLWLGWLGGKRASAIDKTILTTPTITTNSAASTRPVAFFSITTAGVRKVATIRGRG